MISSVISRSSASAWASAAFPSCPKTQTNSRLARRAVLIVIDPWRASDLGRVEGDVGDSGSPHAQGKHRPATGCHAPGRRPGSRPGPHLDQNVLGQLRRGNLSRDSEELLSIGVQKSSGSSNLRRLRYPVSIFKSNAQVNPLCPKTQTNSRLARRAVSIVIDLWRAPDLGRVGGDVGDSGSPYAQGKHRPATGCYAPGRRSGSRPGPHLDQNVLARYAAVVPASILGLSDGPLFRCRTAPVSTRSSPLAQTWHSKIEIRDQNRK